MGKMVKVGRRGGGWQVWPTPYWFHVRGTLMTKRWQFKGTRYAHNRRRRPIYTQSEGEKRGRPEPKGPFRCCQGSPVMRGSIEWTQAVRARRVWQAFKPINEMPGDRMNDPQLDWDVYGNLIVRRTGTKAIRGVVLIDALDVDNANLNGWFVQPRATTDDEKAQGLIRVCKL